MKYIKVKDEKIATHWKHESTIKDEWNLKEGKLYPIRAVEQDEHTCFRLINGINIIDIEYIKNWCVGEFVKEVIE